MKLKSARIRNFRCIKDLEISFEDPEVGRGSSHA